MLLIAAAAVREGGERFPSTACLLASVLDNNQNLTTVEQRPKLVNMLRGHIIYIKKNTPYSTFEFSWLLTCNILGTYVYTRYCTRLPLYRNP